MRERLYTKENVQTRVQPKGIKGHHHRQIMETKKCGHFCAIIFARLSDDMLTHAATALKTLSSSLAPLGLAIALATPWCPPLAHEHKSRQHYSFQAKSTRSCLNFSALFSCVARITYMLGLTVSSALSLSETKVWMPFWKSP